MPDTSLLITATITMHPSTCGNTIDLTAVGADSHPNDPPAWEKEISVLNHQTTAWGQQLADDVLAANSYRRRAMVVQHRPHRLPVLDRRRHPRITAQLRHR